jgi:hypothetical protein
MSLTLLNETELGRAVRERLARGQLPQERTGRVWGGHGTGQPCAVCDRPIGQDEVEYEVQLPLNGAVRSFRFHIPCQAAWQSECARLTQADHAATTNRRG